MVFSRFIWTVLAFVAAITGSAILLGIYLQKPDYPLTASLLIVALVLETAALLYYLTRIRRDLLRLVNSLSNDDPTMQFSRVKDDPYFSSIHQGFNDLIRDFRLVRIDQEARQRFFEETVDHVPFGLVAYNGSGDVKMVNRALLQLLGVAKLERLDMLREQSPEVFRFLSEQEKGKESLLKVRLQKGWHHLICLSSEFVLKGEVITLVSLRDISRELDRNELDAWQKLLRVLRHEILNSLSPIKLIAENLGERTEIGENEWEEVREGLDTIHRRASGLARFMDAYANIYRTPEIHATDSDIHSLLIGVARMYEKTAADLQLTPEVDCPAGLMHPMDQRLIEQVLINLVKNAMDAVKNLKNGKLVLQASKQSGSLIITVRDNGEGIPADQLDSIFIPFYSTREEGTGVGLSFAQHIMRMHGGRIQVRSTPGSGSEFQLLF